MAEQMSEPVPEKGPTPFVQELRVKIAPDHQGKDPVQGIVQDAMPPPAEMQVNPDLYVLHGIHTSLKHGCLIMLFFRARTRGGTREWRHGGGGVDWCEGKGENGVRGREGGHGGGGAGRCGMWVRGPEGGNWTGSGAGNGGKHRCEDGGVGGGWNSGLEW